MFFIGCHVKSCEMPKDGKEHFLNVSLHNRKLPNIIRKDFSCYCSCSCKPLTSLVVQNPIQS